MAKRKGQRPGPGLQGVQERPEGALSFDLKGDWRTYWGPEPLPFGSRALGTVSKDGDTGALILMESGLFRQGNDGKLRTLPQTAVCAFIQAGGRP